MFHKLLADIIGGRDVLSLTVREAMALVAEFYEKVDLVTFGQRNHDAIAYLAKCALEDAGLGFLA